MKNLSFVSAIVHSLASCLAFGLVALLLVTALLTTTFEARAEDPDQGVPGHGRGRIYDTEGTALERPNAVSIELLGRGVLYSLNYDRSLTDHVAVGAGLAAYSCPTEGTA